MRKLLLLCCLLSISQMFSQSNFSKFFKLSGPKRTWVISHPFKAKRALEISKETKKIVDSIAKTNLLDGDISGGQVDAFRHAYWMARLHEAIGKNAACSLGKAHERENYKTYKKQKLEEGVVPDKIASKMDLFNNDVGLTLTIKGGKTNKDGLIYKIVNTIAAGKFKIIKKDKKGNFLTCDGKIIPTKELKGKWENKKCLVPSNKK